MKLFFLSLMSVICGCSVKGYTGSTLPPEQTANVFISTNDGISVTATYIDGYQVPAFSTSVDVPEGTRSIKISFRTEFDDNCFDPASSLCYKNISYGLCEGTLNLKGGLNYLVALEFKPPITRARVSPKGYFDFNNRQNEPSPGALTCN